MKYKKLTEEQSRRAEVSMLKMYMDYHLMLLHEAVEKEDKKEISFQTEQLKKVRERLLELNYFKN